MTAVSCVGIATLDEIWAIDTLPPAGTKTRARDRMVTGGGVAANGAVTVSRLGGRATFVGPLGDDAARSEILAGLEAEGVTPGFVPAVAGQPSPVSVVLVDNSGERTIINHAGPELYAAAPEPAPAEFDAADAVLCDMRWGSGAQVALVAARRRGVPGVVDCDHDPGEAGDVLAAASHIIFSLPTLERHTGTTGPAALFDVSEVSTAWVAATSGAAGVHWLQDGALRHLPAPAVDAVDTLGAGDVFSGAFTLALAEGRPEREALAFATSAAALKCTRFGGRIGIPTRAEVDALAGAGT